MKTDCFAYHQSGKKCLILIENVCVNRDCPFYKTKEQYSADIVKYGKTASQRLANKKRGCKYEKI